MTRVTFEGEGAAALASALRAYMIAEMNLDCTKIITRMHEHDVFELIVHPHPARPPFPQVRGRGARLPPTPATAEALRAAVDHDIERRDRSPRPGAGIPLTMEVIWYDGKPRNVPRMIEPVDPVTGNVPISPMPMVGVNFTYDLIAGKWVASKAKSEHTHEDE